MAGSYSISIPAGTSIKIEVPVDLKQGLGFFPYKNNDTMYIEGKELKLYNGFAVKEDKVGELVIEANATVPTVIYKHLKQKENRIYYFTDNKLFQTIDITNIPIHDHSSIVQGGPAFGTYFADYEVEEEDNSQNNNGT